LFTVLYAWELWRGGVRAAGLWRAAGVLVLAWGACVYAAMPAPDVGFAVQDAVSGGVVHRLLVRYVGETPRLVAVRPVDAVVLGPARPVADAGWRERMVVRLQPPAKSSALDAAPVAQQGPMAAAAVTVVELLSELLWPLADSSLLGLALVGLMLWWARAHGGLVYLVPAVVLWLVGEFLWTTDHHAGMLLLTLVAGVWLTARRAGLAGVESREGMRWRKATWVDGGFVVVLVVVLAGQVVWSASAVWRDHRGAYDPGSELARYLIAEDAGKKIAAFHYWGVAAQPYFARNPFFNLPTAYWQWSSNVFPDALHKQTLDARPDVVVYTQEEPLADEMRNQILPLNVRRGGEPVDPVLLEIEWRGYREEQRFCGERYSRLEAAFRVCDVVFGAGK